MKAVVT